MLVQRWGVLRKAIPPNTTITKTTTLVVSLCKLHNFCINKCELTVPKNTEADKFSISMESGIRICIRNAAFDIKRDHINALLD